jgi:hypothetical protein
MALLQKSKAKMYILFFAGNSFHSKHKSKTKNYVPELSKYHQGPVDVFYDHQISVLSTNISTEAASNWALHFYLKKKNLSVT